MKPLPSTPLTSVPWAKLLGAGALLGAIACNAILGIEDREYDDTGELSCDTYCSEALSTCTGEFALYGSRDACMATCAQLELGESDEDTGDTVGCRLGQVRAADGTGELSAHCPFAGPAGFGRCGNECPTYCNLMQEFCTGFFDSINQCLTECEALPNAQFYSINEEFGNTIECRLYHLTASSIEPDIHCAHAFGTIKCIPDEGAGGAGGGGGSGGN